MFFLSKVSHKKYRLRIVTNIPEQVIAVIQVKKTLYSKDLRDSYNNLISLIDHYDGKNPEPFMFRLVRDGFRAICRKDTTKESKAGYSEQESATYSTLCVEAQLPLRIVWGYNGFAKEQGLRESFYDYLAENVTTDLGNIKGYFGPHNYPNLIICGDASLVKANGMPYDAPLFENGSWPFFVSSPKDPIRILLELLWTRLSYKFKEIPSNIFGEDLENELFNRFINCKIEKLGDKQGWGYNAFTPKSSFFEEVMESKPWMPVEIDHQQHMIFIRLCREDKILANDPKYFEGLVSKTGKYENVSTLVEGLISTGLVHIEMNVIKLLTDQCQCVIMPSGKIYAAENKAGRLTNWVIQQTKEIN